MPFKSQKQRRMFHARAKSSPKWRKMAKKWEEHTPKGKKLPRRKSRSK